MASPGGGGKSGGSSSVRSRQAIPATPKGGFSAPF